MIFQNETFLHLLPLSLLPFLWHFFFKKTKIKHQIGSLFFLKKIYKSRLSKLAISDLLKLILEIIFIGLLVFLFSWPSFRKNISSKNILMFLDSTPSLLEHNKESYFNQIREIAYPLLHEESKTIFLSDNSRIFSSLGFLEINTTNDFETYINNIPIFNNRFVFNDLSKNLNTSKEFLPNETSLLILSDFKENHFGFEKKFISPFPFSIVQIKTEKQPYIISPNKANIQAFENTTIPLTIQISSGDSKTPLYLKIANDEKTFFLKKISTEKNKTTSEKILIKTEKSPLVFYAELFTKSNETITTVDRYFYSSFLKEPISIQSKELLNHLKNVFIYDVREKNIQLKTDGDVFINYLPPPISTLKTKNKKGILFLKSGDSITHIENKLRQITGASLTILKEENQLIKTKNKTPGRFSANHTPNFINLYSGWKNISFNVSWQINSEEFETLLSFKDNLPLVIRKGNWIIFLADPDLQFSDFFQKASSIPLLYYLLFSINENKVFYHSDTDGTQYLHKAILKNKINTFVQRGIFIDEENIHVINRDLKEISSPTFANLNSYFNDKMSTFLPTNDNENIFSLSLTKALSLFLFIITIILFFLYGLFRNKK